MRLDLVLKSECTDESSKTWTNVLFVPLPTGDLAFFFFPFFVLFCRSRIFILFCKYLV